MTAARTSAYKLALQMYENRNDPGSSVCLFISAKVT